MSDHWASALKIGVLRLGLTPEAFWALTLREWRALTSELNPHAERMTGADLNALLRRFPAYQNRT